jgi:hypothetical protein
MLDGTGADAYTFGQVAHSQVRVEFFGPVLGPAGAGTPHFFYDLQDVLGLISEVHEGFDILDPVQGVFGIEPGLFFGQPIRPHKPLPLPLGKHPVGKPRLFQQLVPQIHSLFHLVPSRMRLYSK